MILSFTFFATLNEKALYFYNQLHFINHRAHPPLFECIEPPFLLRLFLENQTAKSPYRATFGGIECSLSLDSAFDKSAFLAFLQDLEKKLLSSGITKIQLTQPPLFYNYTQQRELYSSLLSFGYSILEWEWNYHIPANSQAMLNSLHPSLKRRLTKANKEGFTFQLIKKPDAEEVYQFILNSRNHKGYRLSMDVQGFKNMYELLNDQYPLFVVKNQNEQWVALGQCVLVNPEVLYLIFPADNPDYLNFSPSVFLHYHLVKWCEENGFQHLDLGTGSTMEKGVPNLPLMQYKTRLSAQVSPKATFYKDIKA